MSNALAITCFIGILLFSWFVYVSMQNSQGIPSISTIFIQETLEDGVAVNENVNTETNEDSNTITSKDRALTRMGTNGVEFIDNWRPLPLDYEISDEVRRDFWDGFGTDDPKEDGCLATNSKKLNVATRLAYHGLGMNLLQLANYIMYAGIAKRANPEMKPMRLYFLSTYELDLKRNELGNHAFQNMFEKEFSLKTPETNCDVFESHCDPLPGRCYDGWYIEPPFTGVKMNLWKLVTFWIGSWRHGHLVLHNALKITLIREILRLKPKTRLELDVNHKSVMKDVPKDAFIISMHVRRTDKISGEAKKVEAEIFIKALLKVMNSEENRNYVLFLITDGVEVFKEFSEEFKKYPLLEKLTVISRLSIGRPDRTTNIASAEQSFHYLLVDLRLMIQANVFIGSQSSNLGVVVCLLRVYHECMSVEDPSFSWESTNDKTA